jgi:hypothetical protein
MRWFDLAIQYVAFKVTGDPTTAREAVERALTDRKFKIRWRDDWSGVAERGNKVAYGFLGAFAQHFKVGVRLMSDGPAQTVVRIERLSSGWVGGAFGVSRTTKNMYSLKSDLEATFLTAGVLLGVTEG